MTRGEVAVSIFKPSPMLILQCRRWRSGVTKLRNAMYLQWYKTNSNVLIRSVGANGARSRSLAKRPKRKYFRLRMVRRALQLLISPFQLCLVNLPRCSASIKLRRNPLHRPHFPMSILKRLSVESCVSQPSDPRNSWLR